MLLPHRKEVHAYTHIGSHPLTLDLYIPSPPPSTPQPIILFYHGGFLITGDRTACPRWLINAALKRKWSFASADYRVLPETTILPILSDIQTAHTYTTQHLPSLHPSLVDPSRVIVAGASGGGYLTIVAGTRFTNPRPAALLAIYPMVDPVARALNTRGAMPDIEEADAASAIAEIETRIQQKEVSFGERLPDEDKGEDISSHKRWPYLRFILQEGLYLDYFSGIRGLAAQIAADGKDKAIPEELRPAFPFDYGITSDFPPAVIVHGTGDRDVDVEESEMLVRKLTALGLAERVKYFPVKDADHRFDLRFVDAEDGSSAAEDTDQDIRALRDALSALDGFLK
ncbi:MAG: hypothetical protein M1819_003630 [Sarea resinae]|nr:MAG: hypothetical protein M1819_003630 [Sarea resinae]